MKKIPLVHPEDKEDSNIKFATVDEADYDRVKAAGPWRYHKGYAARVDPNFGKGGSRMLLMHRFIMHADERPDTAGLMFDHKNGDRLDNRRRNLRLATPQENSRNRAKAPRIRNPITRRRRRASSIYKGVTKHGKKFNATIHLNGRTHYIGRFEDEWEAAVRYDLMAIEHFKSFARPNFTHQERQVYLNRIAIREGLPLNAIHNPKGPNDDWSPINPNFSVCPD